MTSPLHEELERSDIPAIRSMLGGRYRVERVLGMGGMGVVVEATNVAIGQRVAIKVLRVPDGDDPKRAVSRFLREARATARIQSDHVVRVMDVGSLPDGRPYMVMERLEGRTLQQLLDDKKKVSYEEAAGYLLQACEGLAEAHAAGIVHRDLKPSNLFLVDKRGERPELKILDFGISKILARPGEAAITTTNALMGSPLYMSPEQMRSSRGVDARADVWSLGAIFYELITGVPPFIGETLPAICLAVMSAPAPSLATRVKDPPAAVQAFVDRCLAKERDERFEDVGVLARALEPIAGTRAAQHAARASETLRLAPSKPPPMDEAEPVDEPSPVPVDPMRTENELRRKRSRRVTTVALAALALGVVIAGVAKVATSSGRPPEASAARPSPAVVPVSSTKVEPPPAPSSDVPSISIDSLPRAPTAAAPRPRAAPASAPAPAPASTPASAPAPASASASAGWQWGDRN